jgi:hypothetical protein
MEFRRVVASKLARRCSEMFSRHWGWMTSRLDPVGDSYGCSRTRSTGQQSLRLFPGGKAVRMANTDVLVAGGTGKGARRESKTRDS